MHSTFLAHRNAQIHCLRFGTGSELLIAVHGFGDRARMFSVLTESLAEKYTVYAIDLPFHGQTQWPYESFDKQDLIAIIHQIMAQSGHSRVNFMGFSFGARLLLATLPEFIGRLDRIFLLSPDGIRTKGMSMAVRTPMWIRRRLFRMLQRPHWFLQLVSTGRKLGIVPPLVHHFLTMNLTRDDRFRRTFGCWFALNSFYLRRRTIKSLLLKTGIPVEVYFGTRDEMIRFKSLRKLVDTVPNARLTLLEEGHRVVGEQLRNLMK